MIASGVVVYVSCQPVDFRKGAASLMALVRDGGLDPFNGAGTTGLVAIKHGRKYVGCELNPEYCDITVRRLIR